MGSRSKIFGIGINDADYVTAPVINGKQAPCPIYNSWKAMLARCYSERYQKKEPTYVGCYVSNDWLMFSEFRKWVLSQDHEGLHLDKDILIFDNRVYAEDRCAYVPRFVNNCFRSSTNGLHAGDLPMGVSAPKKMSSSPRPYATCISSVTKKSHHLGHFSTVEEAHSAWQKAKIEKIRLTGDQYSDHPSCRNDVLSAIYDRADMVEQSWRLGIMTKTV